MVQDYHCGWRLGGKILTIRVEDRGIPDWQRFTRGIHAETRQTCTRKCNLDSPNGAANGGNRGLLPPSQLLWSPQEFPCTPFLEGGKWIKQECWFTKLRRQGLSLLFQESWHLAQSGGQSSQKVESDPVPRVVGDLALHFWGLTLSWKKIRR